MFPKWASSLLIRQKKVWPGPAVTYMEPLSRGVKALPFWAGEIDKGGPSGGGQRARLSASLESSTRVTTECQHFTAPQTSPSGSSAGLLAGGEHENKPTVLDFLGQKHPLEALSWSQQALKGLDEQRLCSPRRGLPKALWDGFLSLALSPASGRAVAGQEGNRFLSPF